MIRYTSTIIGNFEEHCPKAIDFVKQGYSTASDQKDFGVAAHAVLQEVGEKNASGNTEKITAIADRVVQRLITEGRFYYSQALPPMKPSVACAGRDLTIQFLQSYSIPWPAQFEVVLDMDEKGKPCAPGTGRWGAIIDVLAPVEHADEEYAADLIQVDDYKSSWAADEKELETWQRKGQAVLAWLHYPDKQGVRLRVINLRTGKPYDRTIYFDDEGIALLKKWRKDILNVCRAADKTRKARPGAGCIDCPFLDHCADAQKVADSKSNVAALAVLEAKRKELISKLKVQLAETDGVKIDGGFIGYKNQPESTVTDQGIYQVVANWYNKPLHDVQHELGREISLLKTLGVGAGQIRTFAKKVFEGEHKIEREEFEQLCLSKEPNVKFGVWQDKDSDGLMLIKKSQLKKAKAPKDKKVRKAA